jgi:hypothetical protein
MYADAGQSRARRPARELRRHLPLVDGRESDLQRLAREGAVERGLLRVFRRGPAYRAVQLQLHGAGRLGLRTPAGSLGG